MFVNPDRSTAHNPVKGFVFALSGVIVVSTNFVTAKYGTQGFNVETFSTIWTTAAAFYCLAVLALSGTWKEVRVPRGSGWSVAVLGVATAVIMLTGWCGLSRLDPSISSFLWRFGPVLTILLGAIVLGERLGAIEMCALALMVAGGVVSAIGRWNAIGLGVVLTLISCGATAVQLLMAKMRAQDIHPNALVFYRAAIGAVLIAAWTFGTGKADFDVPASYWIVTLVGALLGPCLSYLLLFRSYRYWDLSRTEVVRTMQPLFVLPMAYVAFRKLPVPQEMLGGGLILVGALWIGWVHLRRQTAEQPKLPNE